MVRISKQNTKPKIMTKAVYNSIAQEYKDSKSLSFRKYIEEYTLFEMTGVVSGRKVVDLACGEGFYTRKLKEANAASIVGVDISFEMILLANKQEIANPIGCEYVLQDVAALSKMGDFDLVTAMYLLNYAKTKEELVAFCKAAFKQLKPGGRFVGMNDNIMNDPKDYGNYRKYGFVKASTPERKEGDPIAYTFFNEDGTEFQFNNYYLTPETYQEAFEEAGFVNFKWEGLRLDPRQEWNSFWNDFMNKPPVIGFSAERP